eukprot:snap_masked-scaffold11_size778918-processed-gene-6.8 protein:Tk03684 transcript:snap_masked-scaffold11_size778918-processed-gene-6.8-mRNA-1 annotation:"hypothetical protein DAPPUDRAFT_303190"
MPPSTSMRASILARNRLQTNLTVAAGPLAGSSTVDLAGDKYREEFQRSISNPEEYWGDIASNTVWSKPWTKVMDHSNSPFTKWYDNRDLPGDEKSPQRRLVSAIAGSLARLGVQAGDRTLIYMPMVPQTVVAMLASARLGAPHSVVFGGFAAKELATRIRHCQPKVIICASCGIEPSRTIEYKPMVDEALRLANAPDIPVLVYQRPGFVQAQLGDLDRSWEEELAQNRTHDCVDVDANDPLYVLYTSGTTVPAEGYVGPSAHHQPLLGLWPSFTSCTHLLGLRPSPAFGASPAFGPCSAFGQVSLLTHTSNFAPVVAERNLPSGRTEPKMVIAEHGVNGMFTAPTALRAIKREDHDIHEGRKYDISSLKYLFLAGEHCDHETRMWSAQSFETPVLDHWWQTETAHAITASCVGLGNSLYPPKDVTGLPVPGFNVKILDKNGDICEPGELGRIVCQLPLAPGTFSTLYNGDEKFEETYFSTYPGYYDTMDAGMQDEHGYVMVLARDDDVINVAGHRLSTSALEEAIEEHSDVEEALVIGVPDSLKGQVPLALFIMRNECTKTPEEISRDIVQLVRQSIGPVAAFKLSASVAAFPRTRSGKTARKSIADLAQGKHVKIPPTIEDSAVYEPILNTLQRLGLAKNAQYEK